MLRYEAECEHPVHEKSIREFGTWIDAELGDMIPRKGHPLEGERLPLSEKLGRAFLYARYNPDLSLGGLEALGLTDIDPKDVQALDKVEKIEDMQRVGQAFAKEFVDLSVFEDLLKG